MDLSQLSEENYDIDLSKVFAKLDKMVSLKDLKKVKQEKESLIIQLSESHVLIDSLKSENTMLLNIIDELENKLAKFSSDNLKSMLCIHSDVSNKPDLTVDDLSTSMCQSPRNQEHKVSLFPLVIIVGKLVILGQIVIF
jgi:hypothetical protein